MRDELPKENRVRTPGQTVTTPRLDVVTVYYNHLYRLTNANFMVENLGET